MVDGCRERLCGFCCLPRLEMKQSVWVNTNLIGQADTPALTREGGGRVANKKQLLGSKVFCLQESDL